MVAAKEGRQDERRPFLGGDGARNHKPATLAILSLGFAGFLFFGI